MSSASIFPYPTEPLARRHAPAGYRNYQEFKPWLRDEFSFRCVYCLEREMWYPDRADSFSVDHLSPQSEDPARVTDYANLVYSCTRCNSRKGEEVLLPGPELIGIHLRIGPDGVAEPLTPEGDILIDTFHLNDNPALSNRRHYLDLASLPEAYPADEQIRRLWLAAFRFPEDLPDLRKLRPPEGNRNAGSEEACHFALRERGELPETH